MFSGPGKYGANAEAILRKTDAEMCLVIIEGGSDGGAFDVACDQRGVAKLTVIPTILRQIADNLERWQQQEGLMGRSV
jgi:hypothetical protein